MSTVGLPVEIRFMIRFFNAKHLPPQINCAFSEVKPFKITAAIPTFQRHDRLAPTLESVIEQSLNPSHYEVLIVDNSPQPEPGREFMRRYREVPNLRYVYQDIPGLSRARNRAVKECRSQYIAFIDDDAIADNRWLEEMCALFEHETSEDVGIVGGPVLPVWEEDRPRWLPDELLGFVTIVDWSDEPVELNEFQWLAGTNIAYRMDAIANMDGFREDLGRIGVVRMANDELEFSNRVRKQGWRTLYSPAIRVSHRVPAKRLRREWIRRRNMWQGLSEAVLKGEHYDPDPHWENLERSCRMLGLDIQEVKAVFDATDDPKAFEQQCAAIRALLHILFRGGS